VVPDNEAAAEDALRTAGFLDLFDPREIIRKATVFLMKDRAGTVGVHGVGPMLHDLLANTGARVHLTGHSFGAKVVLSALALVQHPRKVASVLLLQPAINVFCFAQSIQENDGKPGAFRAALERTEMPIFSTFSSRDAPLTNFFHIALRRDGDLGEIRPAAGPPSKFAALGGFGLAGMQPGESKTVPMLAPPHKYDLSNPGIRLYAVDGSEQGIVSHGDVRNSYTEWGLVNLVSWRDLP
jgi:pimeloyl-ACP methyl ester carboxylesterase